MSNNFNEEHGTGELSELLQIRRDKLTAAIDAGKNPFLHTEYPVDNYAAQIVENFQDPEEGDALRRVYIAGRLTAKRDMGKASFADLTDSSGRIQLYIKKEKLGEELYGDFLHCDIGDIVGVSGEVFRTRKGEISVNVDEMSFLAKSLLPLPENTTVCVTKNSATVKDTLTLSQIPTSKKRLFCALA